MKEANLSLSDQLPATRITFKGIPNSMDAEAAIEDVAYAFPKHFDEYFGENSIKLKPGKDRGTVRKVVNNVLRKRGFEPGEIRFEVR